jgi:hypothetical protein
VAGKTIGPQFDLFAPREEIGPSILPLGPLTADEVEIKAVGRNPKSKGMELDLDYFRWEPSILGPGTEEGVWAQVIATHDCEYRSQDLGPDYSGGHQLWIQPCSLKGWIDVAIELPRAGVHDVIVKYTKSWDYAVVQTYLDGARFGPEVDTYAASVIPGEPISLGKRELTAGRHVIRFEAAGHNPESKGYLIGIDHIIVKQP